LLNRWGVLRRGERPLAGLGEAASGHNARKMENPGWGVDGEANGVEKAEGEG